MQQPQRISQPKNALRAEIYGERPLAPMINPPVIYKPQSIMRRALWLSAFALSFAFIAFITLARF